MSDINYEAYPEYASYGDWEDLATAQKKEIERLREMNANLQTAFDEANEETQRFGELLRTENRRIVEREKEIERLRGLLRDYVRAAEDPRVTHAEFKDGIKAWEKRILETRWKKP